MAAITNYDQWIDNDAYDTNGDKIGTITDVFYDDVSGRPEWVAIRTGLFGAKTALAPIAGACLVRHEDPDHDDDLDLDDVDERLTLAYDTAMVKDAPHFDVDEHLTADQERDLYRYYGFNWEKRADKDFGYGRAWDAPRVDTDYKRTTGAIGNVGVEDKGTVEAEATIRNQEARVVEGTETVRLRKYQRTEMVPVTKEEVRVERVTDQEGRRDA